MARGIRYSGALSIVNKKEMSGRREGGETSGREGGEKIIFHMFSDALFAWFPIPWFF